MDYVDVESFEILLDINVNIGKKSEKLEKYLLINLNSCMKNLNNIRHN